MDSGTANMAMAGAATLRFTIALQKPTGDIKETCLIQSMIIAQTFCCETSTHLRTGHSASTKKPDKCLLQEVSTTVSTAGQSWTSSSVIVDSLKVVSHPVVILKERIGDCSRLLQYFVKVPVFIPTVYWWTYLLWFFILCLPVLSIIGGFCGDFNILRV